MSSAPAKVWLHRVGCRWCVCRQGARQLLLCSGWSDTLLWAQRCLRKLQEAEGCYTALSCQAGCTRGVSPCRNSAGHAQPQRPVSQRHRALCHSGSSRGQQSSCQEGSSCLQGRAHRCGRGRAVCLEGSLRIPQGVLVAVTGHTSALPLARQTVTSGRLRRRLQLIWKLWRWVQQSTISGRLIQSPDGALLRA